MIPDQMRIFLEESGVDQNKIDEFMVEYSRVIDSTKKDSVIKKDMREEELRMMILEEKNPRIKASIAARIISLGLE